MRGQGQRPTVLTSHRCKRTKSIVEAETVSKYKKNRNVLERICRRSATPMRCSDGADMRLQCELTDASIGLERQTITIVYLFLPYSKLFQDE